MKKVREEKLQTTCDFRDPLSPWHSFRIRINCLRKSYRKYLLSFLPYLFSHSATIGKKRTKPSNHWCRLWDELVQDIPEACIPDAWLDVRKRSSQKSNISTPPPVQSPFLIPSTKNWKELLAQPLHRAAAYLESQTNGVLKLSLPEGVVPKSKVLFAQQFAHRLRRLGGIPKTDSKLEACIKSVLEWQSESLQAKSNSLALAQAAESLGFDPVRSGLLQNSIFLRSNKLANAQLLLARTLSRCTHPKQIADVLGNMAAIVFAQGDLIQALAIAKEAVAYSSESPIASHNYRAILAHLQTSANNNRQNHA